MKILWIFFGCNQGSFLCILGYFLKAISHTHRNRTEKIKCLKLYERFRRTENVHEFDFIFFGFGGRISTNTTGNFDKICTYTTTCVVYNLVIDRLSSETTVRLFYKHNTVDYRILWDNTQSNYKTTNLMQ